MTSQNLVFTLEWCIGYKLKVWCCDFIIVLYLIMNKNCFLSLKYKLTSYLISHCYDISSCKYSFLLGIPSKTHIIILKVTIMTYSKNNF